MNILEHPIYKEIYDLCQEIEKLPASEQQTKVVVMASNLQYSAGKLIQALRDAVSVFSKERGSVSEERIEAWRTALGSK